MRILKLPTFSQFGRFFTEKFQSQNVTPNDGKGPVSIREIHTPLIQAFLGQNDPSRSFPGPAGYADYGFI